MGKESGKPVPIRMLWAQEGKQLSLGSMVTDTHFEGLMLAVWEWYNCGVPGLAAALKKGLIWSPDWELAQIQSSLHSC